MQRSNVVIWVSLAIGFLGAALTLRPVRAQAIHANARSASDRPGDTAYTPTMLEWAALELQAGYGQTNWTHETPVMINFSPLNDGTTVLCLLQYTPEVPAETVKINREAEQRVFKSYADGRGWPWLQLQFQERVLRLPSR